MRALAFITLTLALAACGPPPPRTYQPQDELAFMRSCQPAYRARLPEGADPSLAGQVCACTWERVTREIPVEDLEAFERLSPTEQAAHPLAAELLAYTLECTQQDETSIEDPPPP
ncbi:MAG TPA: hypothetical protein VFO00_00610 [Vitreimonas sp.]|nr:hypothetical protein [Vitreimonas sp.]